MQPKWSRGKKKSLQPTKSPQECSKSQQNFQIAILMAFPVVHVVFSGLSSMTGSLRPSFVLDQELNLKKINLDVLSVCLAKKRTIIFLKRHNAATKIIWTNCLYLSSCWISWWYAMSLNKRTRGVVWFLTSSKYRCCQILEFSITMRNQAYVLGCYLWTWICGKEDGDLFQIYFSILKTLFW